MTLKLICDAIWSQFKRYVQESKTKTKKAGKKLSEYLSLMREIFKR